MPGLLLGTVGFFDGSAVGPRPLNWLRLPLLQRADDAAETVVAAPLGEADLHGVGARRGQRAQGRPADRAEGHRHAGPEGAHGDPAAAALLRVQRGPVLPRQDATALAVEEGVPVRTAGWRGRRVGLGRVSAGGGGGLVVSDGLGDGARRLVGDVLRDCFLAVGGVLAVHGALPDALPDVAVTRNRVALVGDVLLDRILPIGGGVLAIHCALADALPDAAVTRSRVTGFLVAALGVVAVSLVALGVPGFGVPGHSVLEHRVVRACGGAVHRLAVPQTFQLLAPCGHRPHLFFLAVVGSRAGPRRLAPYARCPCCLAEAALLCSALLYALCDAPPDVPGCVLCLPPWIRHSSDPQGCPTSRRPANPG